MRSRRRMLAAIPKESKSGSELRIVVHGSRRALRALALQAHALAGRDRAPRAAGVAALRLRFRRRGGVLPRGTLAALGVLRGLSARRGSPATLRAILGMGALAPRTLAALGLLAARALVRTGGRF